MSNKSSKHGIKLKRILADFGKRLTIINSKLRIVAGGYEIGDIHSFRTEVKKCKAFLRLVGTKPGSQSKLRLPKNLNRIYKHLGHLRDLQLQQQNIRKLVQDEVVFLPATYLLMNAEQESCKVKVGDMIKEKKSMNEYNAIIKSQIPGALTQVRIKRFVYLILCILRDLLVALEKDDQTMHRIRKLLKELQYNWPYIKNIVHKGQNSLILKKGKITTIAEIIGDFHNTCVALELLDKELGLFAVGLDERKLLMDIRDHWHSERDLLRLKINKELKNLLPSNSLSA